MQPLLKNAIASLGSKRPNKPLHLPAAGFSQLGSLMPLRYVVVCTRGRSLAAIRWAASRTCVTYKEVQR
jgi:hypothetical protein